MNYFDLLKKLQKAYTRLLEPVCRQWELTRNELDVLLFLYNNPHLDRAADIVSCRGIAKSHVSVSVAELEKKGFLTTRACLQDRRNVHLCLTQAAFPAARQGKAAQEALGKSLFADLTEEERLLWRKMAEKVQRNIEKMEEN